MSADTAVLERLARIDALTFEHRTLGLQAERLDLGALYLWHARSWDRLLERRFALTKTGQAQR